MRNHLICALSLMAVVGCASLGPPSQKTDPSQANAATILSSTLLFDRAHASDGMERARARNHPTPLFSGALGARAVSYKGWQYAIYYSGKDRALPLTESYGEVFVARRRQNSQNWQHAKIGGHRIISDDAHNRPGIAISKGDGRIHVTFDHHASPTMNYANTALGVADRPEQTTWDDDTFSLRRNFGWSNFTWSVTYPAMVTSGAGDILLYFRDGGSANGEMQKVRYDSATSAWEPTITRLSDRNGTLNGQRSTRGPYLAGGIHVGESGGLQMSWLFRERNCQGNPFLVDCNQGIFYAQSRDSGKTWLRNDASHIADTSVGEAISLDNVGPPVVDLPLGMKPSNPGQTAAIDPKTNQFHLLISHLARANDDSSRATFHYVRQPDGKWRGKASNFSIRGAELKFSGDRLYAFVGERGMPEIHFSQRSTGFQDWQRLTLPIPSGLPTRLLADNGYVTWDVSQLSARVVSLVWQLPPADGKVGTPTPIWVTDYRL